MARGRRRSRRLGLVLSLSALGVVIVVAVAATTVLTNFLGTTNLSGAGGLCDLFSVWGGGGKDEGQREAAQLDDESKRTAALIISVGKDRKLPPRAWQVALQAGKVESNLHNLPYGDRDSLGIFQMRPSQDWGSRDQILNPEFAINKFYDVLLGIQGWEQLRPGDASQAVERSAFPDRYNSWEALAFYLITNIANIVDTGCGQPRPPGEVAGKVIAFAMAQMGKPYVWGATGPDSYDCSGLTEKAYLAAGITIPRVAADQYTGGGPKLPIDQAQPGDLLFWATDPSNPVTIHHVAIYLGNDELVQAPQTGETVSKHKVWDGGELVKTVVRPAQPVVTAQ